MITWHHATTNRRVQAVAESSSNTFKAQSSYSASQGFSTVDTWTAESAGGTTTQHNNTFYGATYSSESASSARRATDDFGRVTGSSSYSASSTAEASVIFSHSGKTTNTGDEQTASASWTMAQTSITTESGSTSGSTSLGESGSTVFLSYQYAWSFLLTNTFRSSWQASDSVTTYSDSSQGTVTFESTYGLTTSFSSEQSFGTNSYTLGMTYVSTFVSFALSTTRTTYDTTRWSAGSSREVYEGSTAYYTSTALSGSSTTTVSYNTVFSVTTTLQTTIAGTTTLVGSTTTNSSRNGGTYRGLLDFVTAAMPQGNEWLGAVKDIQGVDMRVTDALRMEDGSITQYIARKYIPVATSVLPTSTNSSGTNTNATVVVFQTSNIPSSSSGSTWVTSSYETLVTTVASLSPGSLLPYTRTTVTGEVVFGTSSSSLSSGSTTVRYVTTVTASSVIARTTLFPSFSAAGIVTTSWMEVVTFGYTTTRYTSLVASNDARLVLPETTRSTATTSTTTSTAPGLSYSHSQVGTTTQRSAFGRTLETEAAGWQADIGKPSSPRIWQRSYQPQRAWLAPAPDLAAVNAGTNVAGLPAAFRIPVSFVLRADGAVVYLRPDGTSERTNLVDATGGHAGSVVSSARTSLTWRISVNTISVTTASRVNSTSVTSGSTAAAIGVAGAARPPDYFANGGLAIGGRQKITPGTVILPAGLFNVYRFPEGQDMTSNTVSNNVAVTTTVGTQADLSYREGVNQWVIFEQALPQIVTYSRNHTLS